MKILRLAAILGGITVILGAFGAHTLKTLLTVEQLQVFETGVRYQFYHTLALLFCGLLSIHHPTRQINIGASSFLAGIILFSGSLYLLSTRSLLGIESWSWLGPVTPLGGIMFIIGWIFIFLHAKKIRTD